jgi:hypothetical protein
MGWKWSEEKDKSQELLQSSEQLEKQSCHLLEWGKFEGRANFVR